MAPGRIGRSDRDAVVVQLARYAHLTMNTPRIRQPIKVEDELVDDVERRPHRWLGGH